MLSHVFHGFVQGLRVEKLRQMPGKIQVIALLQRGKLPLALLFLLPRIRIVKVLQPQLPLLGRSGYTG